MRDLERRGAERLPTDPPETCVVCNSGRLRVLGAIAGGWRLVCARLHEFDWIVGAEASTSALHNF